jgi:hypothetical protein
MRTQVKLAASMLVCFSAWRHSSELAANAIIANEVKKNIREREIKGDPKPVGGRQGG